MAKRSKKGKMSSDEQNEQVEDIVAWGNRKDNYYQDSSNEYSEIEEQQQQAKKIYQRQLQQLNNQDLFEIPNNKQYLDDKQLQQDEEIEQAISHTFLTKQIKNMAKLGLQISEFSHSKLRTLLQQHIQAYLMTLIGLRELEIPFIEHHPLVGISVQMRQDINKLKHLLSKSTQTNSQNHMQQDEEEQGEQADYHQNVDQQDYDDAEEEIGSQQNDQIEQGLQLYKKVQQKQQAEKKIKKQMKKTQRLVHKKPAFLQVKDNEGRLASEQILKNKGLIKKRKKIDRNGRVKLRRKFDKATSKRRAYGHFIRQNPGRNYEGEANIKYGRIASTKLK